MEAIHNELARRRAARQGQQSGNGGTLSAPQAQQYLNAAGGDRSRARQMARADGWNF